MKYISLVLAFSLCFLLCGCKSDNIDLDDISFYESTPQLSSVFNESSDINSSDENISSVDDTSSVTSESTQSTVSNPERPQECSHEFEKNFTEATCTIDGVVLNTCKKCGITVKETVKAKGHTMSDGECTVCDFTDVAKSRAKVCEWFNANSVSEYYTLTDSRYQFKAAKDGSIYFMYSDTDKAITVSLYGFELNKCYIEYHKEVDVIEREFPMDSVHSSERSFFNDMNGSAEGENKTQMISELRGEIDGFFKTFEAVIKANTGVTLKDIGFTNY